MMLQKMICLVNGHETLSIVRDQPNDKVVKYDLTCVRCEKVTGTLTWPNMNYRQRND